ncbi:phage tail protein [Lactobacillus plantarum]|uniref:tape measure protein n=1 Tax=Lactiplantibacillus plantarum TaxID=1590 RepID=UPI00143D78AF|nr:tape measure protein [Lactiplantibacillus plantarum]MBE1727397.1 phage tail protein [Lactiplantibacillus plantarum]NKI39454.1 phage tail protein [Lactiplantibacillus plantarum]
MEKIQGYQFAIDMDDGGMTRTMRELKNEAKLLKSGMQANFAEIRSGEGIMAAYANKVKDAGRAIDAQRVYIEKLKSEQNGLDQSTVHGRESYLKYENQIESAKRTIGSLQSQQERAKQSLDLQKSGVLQLKDATELNDKVTQSYIGRLKAEGNEFEANKAKAGGLHQSYKDLNKQLEAEQSQLEKVGKASGEDSRQYKEQQVRVNDLGTKIAETRTKMKELDGQLGKKPRTGLTGVIGQLNKVQEHTTKVDHLFGKVFGAHLLANGVVNAWQSLTSHIGEAVEAGKEYDKEQQKMNATWTTLTGNAKDGKAMVDVTNKLSVALGQDVDVTDELNQQFYHVLDKQGPTEKLTKSVLTMGDAVGMSGDNVKNLGLNFTHMMSSSKMQLGDFNHITDALPMYGEALLKYEQQVQKNSKLTMSQLRKQMSAGKITAEDAEKVMNRLGGKYQEASENLMKTIPGMERVIKSRVPALLGDIEKPIMNAQNPIYGAVSKWVSDKRTEREFTKVGTAANKGLTTVTKAFAKAFDVKSAPKLMDDAMNGLANGVTKASDTVARNAPEITDFFKTVKNLGGVGFETLIDSLKITNAILKPTLSLVGGHTETIAKFGAAWWVADKAIKGTSDVLSTFKKVSDTVSWAAKVFGIKQETKALAEQNGVLKTNAELSAAGGGSSGGSKVAEEVSGGADGKVAKELAETEKGGAKLGKFAKMGERLKSLKSISGAGKALVGSTGVLDVLMAGTDLIGTTKKNVGDHVGGATGNLAGGAIGGTIGTLIAPGIGTAIGAGIGSMGGDKLGRLIGKKIQGGLSKTKLKIPKPKPLSMKSSYDKLNKQAKSYYSKKAAQDKADLKLLLKNGDITKAEYDRRMKDVKKSTESESRYEKMSQSDRTAVAKYYSQSRAKLTSSWNSKITKDTKKWNSKIAKDTRLYGSQSLQVEKDENRKRAALRKDESKKKSALSKQELKFATQMTAREARLHTTLTGKIKLASDQQSKILTKLKDKKNKLSKQQLQTAVNSSRKEYQQTVSNANKEYKSRVSDAEHQHDKITKAAERQYKSTVASAKRQYSGNSKYAKQQRQKIISEALEQENKTEKHADEQYKKVTDRAEKQKTQSINSAKNQHTKVVKEAKAQNSEVTDESDSQRKTVNDNNDKTKKHSDSVWKDITKTVGGWLGGILPIH